MELNEINAELKKLPKDEMIMIMKFRTLSAEKKMQFILDVDRELEELYGEEGRKIFDSVFD